MLACELDVPIGIDVPLTVLSSVLAVFFTFASLASDLLWDRLKRRRRKKERERRKAARAFDRGHGRSRKDSTAPVVLSPWDANGNRMIEVPPPSDYLDAAEGEDAESHVQDGPPISPTSPRPQLIKYASFHTDIAPPRPSVATAPREEDPDMEPLLPNYAESSGFSDSQRRGSSDPSTSRRSSSVMGSNTSSLGLGNLLNIAYRGTSPAKNVFIYTGLTLYHGFTLLNVAKGFCWSLAITSMHYVGIFALQVPDGYPRFNLLLVLISATISWVVCIVGCIMMPQMESHIQVGIHGFQIAHSPANMWKQQLLFSLVATLGVAAMHFTGTR